MGLITMQIEGFPKVDGQGKIPVIPQSSLSFGDVLKEAAGEVAEGLDYIFKEASAASGVPENLLKAVAKTESNFNPKAVSGAGAMGVMQLMPGTARSLGVEDPFDARQNIFGGAKYLRENLERFDGNVSLALAAYNAGPGNVEKYGGIPPFEETQNYVKKILNDLGGRDQVILEPEKTVGGSYTYMASGSGLQLFNSDFGDALTSSSDGTVTLDKNTYLSLIQMLRLQMMNQAQEAGDLFVI